MTAQAYHGGQLWAASREFGLPGEELLDFSSNINPFAPSLSPEQWLEWKTEITRYPETDAISLQHQLAEVYQVPTDFILPTSGGIEALYLATRLFLGKNIGVLEPAFSDYSRAVEALGQTPQRVVLPLDLSVLPITKWADRLRSLEVVLLGNPNNPTGSFQSFLHLRELWQEPWTQQQSWIIDEAFLEFVPEAQRETVLALLPENVIVLRSLTKSWGLPGLRLGFLATSNRAWMEQLRRLQPPWSINAVAQAWAKAFLTSRHHADLQRGLRELHHLKLSLQACLSEIPGVRIHPSAANFILIQLVHPSLDSTTLYQALGQKGLITRRCDSFHGLAQGRFLRVAVKLAADNQRLVNAFTEISQRLTGRAA